MRLLKICLLGLLVVTAVACSTTSKEEDRASNGNQARLTAPLANPQWARTNWSATSSFFSLYASQDQVLARTWDSLNGGRMFVTADVGASWNQIGSADTDTDILSIVLLSNGILAGTWNGFYSSTSGGTSLNAVTLVGIPADTAIRSIASLDTNLFAATTGHLYKSVDNGNSWIEVSAGLPTNATATSIVAIGSAIFAGSDANGVYVTTNGGTSWSARNSGLTDTRIAQLAAIGARLFAVTPNGVFVTDNDGTSWVADGSSLKNINCFVVASGQLLAGTDNSGVYLSGDSGVTWASFNSGLPDSTRVWSLAATSDSIFAGTDSGVWRTPTTAGPNSAPTLATAASANANPVSGQNTDLSALGSDDGGEANLTYTWATTGTAPAAVSFNTNGTNAAKNTTATFSKAGSYTLLLTVKDQAGLSATSTVAVTVDQTLTSIMVAPTTSAIAPLTTQQFVATARDQFAAAMLTQPSFSWSVSGGGTIDTSGLFTAGATSGGPYAVTATSAGISGTANATVASTPTPIYQINCGSSSASSPFGGDQYGSGGTQHTVTNSITVSGITNPAPMAVYQSERYGNSTYSIPNLTSGSQYKVRLHFAELYQTATGKRLFNVVINGTTMLSNFDIYAITGARYKAVVREFTATPNSSGQIVLNFNTVTDNATIGGIEIIALAPNNPPSLVTAAAAVPDPISGTTTALSALGADDTGEATLLYTWASTGTPPASVVFSANGSNAAKTTTATFAKAGNYAFQVTIKDQGNLTATSSVAVTVNQTLTSVIVSPSSATLSPGATQQFTATARDQFATSLAVQPVLNWSTSGGGTISSSGLLTASTTTGGPFTVTAQSIGVSGTASVAIGQTIVYQINCGGSAASPYTADQYFSGGSARTVTNSIAVAGVTSSAPQAVYQAERYGAVTYTLPNLTAGASYLVRLHFAELYWTSAGKRKFNVAINGATILSNYDIYSVTGARYKAIVREFAAAANTSGQIVIAFTNVTDNATIEGIQVIRQ